MESSLQWRLFLTRALLFTCLEGNIRYVFIIEHLKQLEWRRSDNWSLLCVLTNTKKCITSETRGWSTMKTEKRERTTQRYEKRALSVYLYSFFSYNKSNRSCSGSAWYFDSLCDTSTFICSDFGENRWMFLTFQPPIEIGYNTHCVYYTISVSASKVPQFCFM